MTPFGGSSPPAWKSSSFEAHRALDAYWAILRTGQVWLRLAGGMRYRDEVSEGTAVVRGNVRTLNVGF